MHLKVQFYIDPLVQHYLKKHAPN